MATLVQRRGVWPAFFLLRPPNGVRRSDPLNLHHPAHQWHLCLPPPLQMTDWITSCPSSLIPLSYPLPASRFVSAGPVEVKGSQRVVVRFPPFLIVEGSERGGNYPPGRWEPGGSAVIIGERR